MTDTLLECFTWNLSLKFLSGSELLNAESFDSKFSKQYFDIKGKDAERFVQELAEKTFLTDWCYPNPKSTNGKEICDLLVVYDSVAIIWQVKDLKADSSGQPSHSELGKNSRQLGGARRILFDSIKPIELKNSRRPKEFFYPEKITEIFLISAILGDEIGELKISDEVKGSFVHVFANKFTEIVLNELDTVVDFIEYLRARERLIKKRPNIELSIKEENLLAHFLDNERSLDSLENSESITVNEEYWEIFIKSNYFLSQKAENKSSYYWDGFIDALHADKENDYEVVAREFARTTRYERRMLSKNLLDTHVEALKKNADLYNRYCSFDDKFVCCFAFFKREIPKDAREGLLEILCYRTKKDLRLSQNVIGLAMELGVSVGSPVASCFLNSKNESAELDELLRQFKVAAGGGPIAQIIRSIPKEDEYPGKTRS